MKLNLAVLNSDIPLPDALKQAFGNAQASEIYQKLVDRIGIHPYPDPSAHGMKGVVYNLGDDHVLKLTSDASEIEAMHRIKKRPSQHLVLVNDVFLVCGRRYKRNARLGLGAIVREFVGDQSMEDEPEFDVANSALRNIIDAAEDKLRVLERYKKEPPLEASKIVLEIMLDDLRHYAHEYPIFRQVATAIQELGSRGIYGIDFAPRNMAIADDGTLVIFDVGVVVFEKPSRIPTVGCEEEVRLV